MSSVSDVAKVIGGTFYNSCGLDFGTSRSMIGYVDRGQKTILLPRAFDDPQNLSGIPSLFQYAADGREYVCSQVLDINGPEDDPEGVCLSVKMRLEEPQITLNGKSFTPAYIACREIQVTKELCHEAILRTIPSEPSYQNIVAGVPVRFGDELRRKYIDILRTAFGSDANIRLLPEPIAAALSYQDSVGLESSRKVLVFDMGAGTFDTVLLMPNRHRTPENPYPYRDMRSDGSYQAGDHFDRKMMDLILRKLQENQTSLDLDMLRDPVCADHLELKSCARRVKEKLSRVESIVCSVQGTDHHYDRRIERVTITRREFENEILEAVDQAVACAWDVLKSAGLHKDPSVHVILVGGSTHIPLIRQRLMQKLPHIPAGHILQHEPELAVVRGCALFALKQQTDPPSACGYAIAAYQKDKKERGLNVVIPSGASAPYYYSGTFSLSHKGSALTIVFYEVESALEGERLRMDEGVQTETTVTHQFGCTVDSDTKIQLSIDLDTDGTLVVTVDDGIQPEKAYPIRLRSQRTHTRSSI